MEPINCRVCLQTSTNYSSLFETHQLFTEKLSLFEYIEKVTSIKLQITNKYSDKLCENCIVKLNTSFEFIENVRRSENNMSLLGNKILLDDLQEVIEDEVFFKDDKPFKGTSLCDSEVDDLQSNIVSDQKVTFTCSKCDKKFPTERSLNYHREKNHGESLSELNHVTTLSNGRRTWVGKKDVKSHSKDLSVCAICQAYVRRTQLRAHVSGHQDKDGNYSCPKCGRKCSYVHAFRRHYAACTVRFCFICRIKISKAKFASHILTHKNENGMFHCSKCEIKCSNYRVLHHHFQLHRQHTDCNWESKHTGTCCICGDEQIRSEFKAHILTHQDENGYLNCPKCDSKQPDYAKLKSHIQVTHTDSSLVCSHCGLKLSRTAYNHHILSHASEDKYIKCEHCPKKYLYPSLMKHHVLTQHSTERKLACNECGNKFFSKVSLKKHKTMYHTAANRCTCELCGREFDNIHRLKIHVMDSHMKNHMRKCYLCNAMFSSRQELRNHSNMHDERRSLRCCVCDRRFFLPFALRRHLIKEHPNADLEECLKNSQGKVDGRDEY